MNCLRIVAKHGFIREVLHKNGYKTKEYQKQHSFEIATISSYKMIVILILLLSVSGGVHLKQAYCIVHK